MLPAVGISDALRVNVTIGTTWDRRSDSERGWGGRIKYRSHAILAVDLNFNPVF